MKFLILNRFDPLSPKAAGAELFTSELAARLVRDGHSVTWFASQFKDAQSKDEYKGIKIVRKGNVLSVLWWAFRHYQKRKKEFDFVIDEIHAYPFFTKFYVPKHKRISLVHEVTGKIWYYMAPYYTFHLPLGLIGDIFERIMYRFFYRNEKFITVSESTRKELIDYGVKGGNITVLSEGITLSPNASERTEKSEKPQIVYFGGMRPLKRVEHQLAALKDLKQDFPYLRHLILGRRKGRYFGAMKRLVKRLDLQDIVEFTGFVSAEKRDRLTRQSWLTVSTSVKEGWGLAVAEAAALGIPAVVYNVPGNRDAVKHLETGLYTIDNTPEMLAQAIRKLLLDTELRGEMGRNARKFAETLDWEKSYKQFKEVIGLS